MQTPIETARLILRPFTEADILPSYHMNLDAAVSRYTGDGGVVSLEEMSIRITKNVMGDYKRYGFGRFAVEWKETGEFIGFAGLKYLPERDEVDLGYRLKKSYWGKGLATEAGRACMDFGWKELQLGSVIAMVLPDNKASIRVLDKLGFRFKEKDMEDDMEFLVYSIINQKG